MSTNRRIPVSNGLLCPDHHEKVGASIWVFLWCIDRTTEEYESPDGARIGKVLGGRPFQIARICGDLGICDRQARTHLANLQKHGYISVAHEGRGVIVEVAKAKKWGDEQPMVETQSRAQSRRKTAGVETPIAAENCRGEVADRGGKLQSDRQKTAGIAPGIRMDSVKGQGSTNPPLNPPPSPDPAVVVVEIPIRPTGKPCHHFETPRSLTGSVSEEDYQILCEYYAARPVSNRLSAGIALLQEYSHLPLESKQRAVQRARAKVAGYDEGANPTALGPLRDQLVNEDRPNRATLVAPAAREPTNWRETPEEAARLRALFSPDPAAREAARRLLQ